MASYASFPGPCLSALDPSAHILDSVAKFVRASNMAEGTAPRVHDPEHRQPRIVSRLLLWALSDRGRILGDRDCARPALEQIHDPGFFDEINACVRKAETPQYVQRF